MMSADREREAVMEKQKVLFVCVHNSARSQMAEAWLNHLCGDLFEAESAGLEPGTLNPLAIEVMKELGIDISHKKPRSVFDLVKTGGSFRMSLRSVTRQVQRDVPSSWLLQNDCTGAFLTLLPSRGQQRKN
jgi:predicted protein tyrosine phosphatase